MIVYIPLAAVEADTVALRATLDLFAASIGVVVVSAADSARFAADVRSARQRGIPVLEPYQEAPPEPRRRPWVVTVGRAAWDFFQNGWDRRGAPARRHDPGRSAAPIRRHQDPIRARHELSDPDRAECSG